MLLTPNVNAGEVLDEFLWRNRLILISAPSPSNTLFKKQSHLLNSELIDLVDRDLVIISAFADTGDYYIDGVPSGPSKKLLNKFKIPKSEFCLILVGKDGTPKLRKIGSLVNPKTLFSLIDSMPMRKYEMATKKYPSNP